MQDNFEKEFSDRMKVVFEDYDDGGSEQGWAMMQARLNDDHHEVRAQHASKTGYYLWRGVAAAVLLLLGLFTWENMHQDDQPNIITYKSRKALKEDTMPGVTKPVHHTPAELSGNTGRSGPASTRGNQFAAQDQLSSGAADRTISTMEPQAKSFTLAATAEPRYAALLPDSGKAAAPALSLAANAAGTQQEKAGRPAERLASFENTEEHHKKVAERLAGLKENSGDVNDSHAAEARLLNLGLTAGSFVNYSEGSKASVNPSLGLQSELKLSKKLRLATGLMLAQNKLSYKSGGTADAQSAILAAASPVVTNSELTIVSISDRARAYSYNLNGYDASLLGIDIPLNLKYIVSEKKNDLYVSAGLSSNYFIREQYTYRYSTSTYAGESRNSQVSNDASSFSFGSLLNVSMGMAYPLGKLNKLSVEPYVKYPLGSQGSENLKFGSAGINLKFNFGK